jgi:hypothetical protein
MEVSVELNEFKFERFSFEIRYAKAFLLWDRAGSFSTALKKMLPELSVREAIPSRLQFSIERDFEITVEMEKTFLIAHFPKSDLKTIEPVSSGLAKLCTEILEVSSFSRIGARFTYFKEFDSLNNATQMLLSMETLNPPQGKFFGHEYAPKEVGCTMRWEGKTAGTTVRVQTASLQTEFTPPPILRDVKPIFEENHHLILDIDYYTIGHVLPTQFDSVTWIQNAAHLIHRDAVNFIGGKR